MAKHALVKTKHRRRRLRRVRVSSFGGWRMNAAGNRFNPNYGFRQHQRRGIRREGSQRGVRDGADVGREKERLWAWPSPTTIPAGVNRTITITAAEAAQPSRASR
jgi:hypothetical protein